MDFRFAFLILLLIAGAFFAESSAGEVPQVEFTRVANGDGGFGTWKACNGLAGDCTGEEKEMGMESESRRGLRAQVKYISYAALSRNRVPCNQRGQSYYNCQQGQRVNPYRRGCSIITQCARILN